MQWLTGSTAHNPALLNVIELGLQHEQQHQELILTDIKHLFSFNPLHPAYQRGLQMGLASDATAPAPPLHWLHFEEGLHWLGHAGDGFSFDNELPRHRVFNQSFELATRPATNGEYLEFMQDGGYTRPELWLSDGWGAVSVFIEAAQPAVAEPGQTKAPAVDSVRGPASPAGVLVSQGVVNVVSRNSPEASVVVMGDVPETVVTTIAASVAPRPQKTAASQ